MSTTAGPSGTTSSTSQSPPALQANQELRRLIQDCVTSAVDSRMTTFERSLNNQFGSIPAIKNPERQQEDRMLDKVKLNNKQNERQFDFCREVINKINDANENMDNDINLAKEALAEGKKLLLRRIKLIRFADRENWVAVNEYLSDELASDSEDEKHMSRAIKSANTKIEKRKKVRQQKFESQVKPGSTQRVLPYSMPYSSLIKRPVNRTCWICGSRDICPILVLKK